MTGGGQSNSDIPNEQLLTPTLLFRFSAPLLRRKTLWSKSGIQLEKKYTLPSFGELEDRPPLLGSGLNFNDDALIRDHHVAMPARDKNGLP